MCGWRGRWKERPKGVERDQENNRRNMFKKSKGPILATSIGNWVALIASRNHSGMINDALDFLHI